MITMFVKFARSDMKALHEFLDTFSPGWTYYHVHQDGYNDENEMRIRKHNEDFSEISVANGTGATSTRIHICVQERDHAMSVKLSWPGSDLYVVNIDNLTSYDVKMIEGGIACR